MELTELQKKQVADWVDEGCGLSEIQRKLNQEFDIRATFMDVRFLIIDLNLDIKEEGGEEAGEKPEEPPSPVSSDDAGTAPVEPELLPPEGSSVSVDIDRVVKPGALVSGSVTFSDGVTASWMLDQFGRLALDASDPGYRPSQEDVQAFQQVLQEKMAQKGY